MTVSRGSPKARKPGRIEMVPLHGRSSRADQSLFNWFLPANAAHTGSRDRKGAGRRGIAARLGASGNAASRAVPAAHAFWSAPFRSRLLQDRGFWRRKPAKQALRVWPAFAVQPLLLSQGAPPPPGAGSKFRHLHPWFRGPNPETAERLTEKRSASQRKRPICVEWARPGARRRTR